MVFFVTVLRALAACVITNSHYSGVYPVDLIANGGLIGDVLFFAVSGYCLCNVKLSFVKWYLKRLYRVYVPVWIISALFLIIGAASLTENSLIYYFVYPTDYHFIASIVLLYVPFYLLMKVDRLKKHIPYVMLAVAAVAVLVYIFFYDKTYYHIDKVREPFIRFLFAESMLLGAYFKVNDASIRNKFSVKWIIFSALSFVFYFATKIFFSRFDLLQVLQIINQFSIFVLLYSMFRLFSGLDSKLEKLPAWLQKVIVFIADMTLEIYLVQYVIIDLFKKQFVFPINWLVITVSIVASAFLLHIVCGYIYKFFYFIAGKRKKTVK